MSNPLTVLIAAAGQPDLLARTLDSLAACEHPPQFAETVVVENGPKCGIEAIVRSRARRERVRYEYVAEANKSHALNVALARLDGLIFYTDDDTRVAPQLLNVYARAAQGVSGGEFYGGPIIPEYETAPPPAWLLEYMPKTVTGWRESFRTKTRIYRTMFGPNWAAFAGDLRAIGGFEPRLGPGAVTNSTGQETEAQNRLFDLGAKAYYLPDAQAWHFVRAKCCTPQWAIQRGYRHGLEWGIRYGRDPKFTGLRERFVGFRLFRRRWICRIMRMMGGEQRRVAADYMESRWQGRWDGIAIGRKWDEIAVPELPPEMKRAA
jgi:GT2 family glycosyltransferase